MCQVFFHLHIEMCITWVLHLSGMCVCIYVEIYLSILVYVVLGMEGCVSVNCDVIFSLL
jgi:hypothetical protein